MNFKKLKLDDFQEFSIKKLDKNHSVIVNAPTGTGKTLIADYLIDKYLKFSNKKVIYTSPIKALSNQKFKDFKQSYGSENIGLLTGDIVFNPNAQILIMTTEIYRNMLLSKDNILDDIEYKSQAMSDGGQWSFRQYSYRGYSLRFHKLASTPAMYETLCSVFDNRGYSKPFFLHIKPNDTNDHVFLARTTRFIFSIDGKDQRPGTWEVREAK